MSTTGDTGQRRETSSDNKGENQPLGEEIPTPKETERGPRPSKFTIATCKRWLTLRTEIRAGHLTAEEARDGLKQIYHDYGCLAEDDDVSQASSALRTAATQSTSGDDIMQAADRLSDACDDATLNPGR